MSRGNLRQGLWAAIFVMAALGAQAGQLSLGLAYDGWNSNYLTEQTQVGTHSASELWVPFSFSLSLGQGVQVFGQGLFGDGNYTYSPDGINNTNLNLSGLTDSVLGGEIAWIISVTRPCSTSASACRRGTPHGKTNNSDPSSPPSSSTTATGAGFGFSALYGLSFPFGKTPWAPGRGSPTRAPTTPRGTPTILCKWETPCSSRLISSSRGPGAPRKSPG